MDEIQKYKDKKLVEILKEITKVEPKELSNEKKEEFIDKLLSYKKNRVRMSYSDIGLYMDEIYDNNEMQDDYLALKNNLNDINLHLAKLKDNRAKDDLNLTRETLIQIMDNIEIVEQRKKADNRAIEILRSLEIKSDELEKKSDELEKKSNKLDNDLKIKSDELAEDSKKVMERLDKFNIETLTMVGLFSGIVMAGFGGINFLSSAINNMDTKHYKLLIQIILIVGLVIFNIMYSFFWMIGKVIGKPLCFCENDYCVGCYREGKCHQNRLHKTYNRHTPLVIINILIVIMLIIFYIATV